MQQSGLFVQPIMIPQLSGFVQLQFSIMCAHPSRDLGGSARRGRSSGSSWCTADPWDKPMDRPGWCLSWWLDRRSAYT